ncbi:hypothetical protein PENTCL1PPCAC_25991, partial [Pristionchus entomophagus]
MSFFWQRRMLSRVTSRAARTDRIVHGAMLQLRCHDAPEASVVEWSQDGEPVHPTFSNWRMEVTDEGALEIWPLVYNDTGRWECTAKGEYRGALEIQVLSMTEAYLIGIAGYFTISICFMPILAIGIACLSARHLDPPSPEYDPIADLLTKQVDGAQFR